jgi:MFS family permease
VTGLVLYSSGAVAMVFAQGLAAIIVFWAFIGGLGAALYLPAMQSLIHGNFEGKMQAKVFALTAPRARSPRRSARCWAGC